MKFYIFLLVLTQILFFYFHLVSSATSVESENEKDPSKLKGLILSFLGLLPPPPPSPKASSSPPLNDNSNNNESISVSKLLSNLPNLIFSLSIIHCLLFSFLSFPHVLLFFFLQTFV